MAETTKKRRKRVKINYIRLMAVIFSLVLIGTVGFYAQRIASLHAEREQLLAEKEELEQTREARLNELENVNDLDYIEEQARKQLKMIKPGEVLFVIDGDALEAPAEGQAETGDAGTSGDAIAAGSTGNAG